MISELHHMHWRDLAGHVRRTVGQVDALIVDAPYSERTHSGHDSAEAYDSSGAPRDNKVRQQAGLEPLRRGLGYASWTTADVDAFVAAWAPLTRGWIVSLTDDALAPAWRSALDEPRYSFSPLACVESGSRVRLSGDGPSQWACWAVVSRPRGVPFSTWGTLPGAYVGSTERGRQVVGGKPLWLMEALVRDYTRPGDLVCDPCMGAGTTLLAAKLLGRQYIGGDLDEKHVAIARERLRDLPAEPDRRGTMALPWEK